VTGSSSHSNIVGDLASLVDPKIHLHHRRLDDPMRIFLPLFLPIIQRRHRHLGMFRIRVMYRLRIMPQRLLRKPLRIAALQSTFRPDVFYNVLCPHPINSVLDGLKYKCSIHKPAAGKIELPQDGRFKSGFYSLAFSSRDSLKTLIPSSPC